MKICDHHLQQIEQGITERGMKELRAKNDQDLILGALANASGNKVFEPMLMFVENFCSLVKAAIGFDRGSQLMIKDPGCPFCAMKQDELVDVDRWMNEELDRILHFAVDSGMFAQLKEHLKNKENKNV